MRMKNVTILDREFPDVENLVFEIRDKKNMGHRLGNLVEELGKLESEIIIGLGHKKENISIACVPRAGVPLAIGVNNAFRCGSFGFITAVRDENTLLPKIQYCGMPYIGGTEFKIVDSMAATCGTLINVIELIESQKDYLGVPEKITVICAIATEYGINKIVETYGNHVDIVSGTMVSDVVDGGMGPGLYGNGYIINPYGEPRDLGDDIYGKRVDIRLE